MTLFKKDAISCERSKLKKGRAALQQQSIELENLLRQKSEDSKKLKLAVGEQTSSHEVYVESVPLKAQKRRARNRFIALCFIGIILLIVISKLVF